MKNKFVTILIALMVNLFFISFTKAQDTNENIPGTPPADSITYIIVDGPGRGTQIHASPGSTNFFAPDINVTTQAAGHLAEPDRCKGPQLHYHGALFGETDPAMFGCGWGHVIKFDDLMDGSQLITAAFMRELRAQQKALVEPRDLDGAITDLNDAISDLNELKDLPDSMLTEELTEEIDTITMIDSEVIDLVNEFKNTSDTDIGFENKIDNKLDLALEKKEKTLKGLLKSEPAAKDLPRYIRGPRREPRGPR